jgi:hypothetical protein
MTTRRKNPESDLLLYLAGAAGLFFLLNRKKASAAEPPTEQPPGEQPPVEQPPVEQPPVEQPPVEQPPVTQPPVVFPPASVINEHKVVLAVPQAAFIYVYGYDKPATGQTIRNTLQESDAAPGRPFVWAVSLSPEAYASMLERYRSGVGYFTAQADYGAEGKGPEVRLPFDLMIPGSAPRVELAKPIRVPLPPPVTIVPPVLFNPPVTVKQPPVFQQPPVVTKPPVFQQPPVITKPPVSPPPVVVKPPPVITKPPITTPPPVNPALVPVAFKARIAPTTGSASVRVYRVEGTRRTQIVVAPTSSSAPYTLTITLPQALATAALSQEAANTSYYAYEGDFGTLGKTPLVRLSLAKMGSGTTPFYTFNKSTATMKGEDCMAGAFRSPVSATNLAD